MAAIDESGHLFARFPLDGVDYCVGCGHPKGSPEAAGRCSDAEGLAVDMEAQAIVASWSVGNVKVAV